MFFFSILFSVLSLSCCVYEFGPLSHFHPRRKDSKH
ncbi:hypothetical protein GLYMA_19G194432v4 [Glycine max]|nr:hypothetical protein GLYMA_19G194432v4 [Glycine max]KAH1078635.1 hypothetical protein GYH30_053581 [Glycine max]